jgi:predicted SnoaL-like aldol condensation-catalyzing enzyme
MYSLPKKPPLQSIAWKTIQTAQSKCPNRRDAFIDTFTHVFEQNTMPNTQIQGIYTDDEYVIAHSFVPFGEASNAIVDIYRIK